MASPLKEFGDTAKDLSRNPLGIIALFIVLVYALASILTGFGREFQPGERLPLIWFLALFPVAVLAVFAWLVSQHNTKLYAPKDYKNEEHFLQTRDPDLRKLRFASPNPSAATLPPTPTPQAMTLTAPDLTTSLGRAADRNRIYQTHRGFFIAHVIEPSTEHGQEFDVFIYLVRHKSTDYADITKSEFFFGHYWGNEIFQGERVGKYIGVKTAAYGPFLCTCAITFRDGATANLYRYIDFEMSKYFKPVTLTASLISS